ncbi:C3a anaphylatoxin chemotactic receptor [Amia ocellicauda]|uniref:C3a anaphylatoxin chemotactic receptor n=1 Tax=Amia ocellicauda TaxID=2972642 RepID=UPI00346415F3
MEKDTTIIPKTTEDFEYYEEEEMDSVSSALHYTAIVCYCLAFLLGTCGNGLVIFITGCKMKKTLNTVWFLNLSVADFLFTAFLPIQITYSLRNYNWPFNANMCRLNSFILVLNMFASIFLLTVISLDRCLSVMAPVWAHNKRSPRKAEALCLVVWILACLCSVPFIVYRDIHLHTNKTSCAYVFPKGSEMQTYQALILTRFFLGFLFPFLVIVASYGSIGLRYRSVHKKRSFKPFRVILAVILTFFICWMPFHVFQLLTIRMHNSTNTFKKAVENGLTTSTNLAFFNSCLNPVLYVCMCQDFREKFRKSFLLVFESAFIEEHPFLSSTRRSTVQMDSLAQGLQPNGTPSTAAYPNDDN